MNSNYFLFDKNKCVGCSACVVACMNENGYQFPESWRNVHSSNPEHHPFLPLSYLSIACNHCEEAPCMKNCPALAFKKNDETGSVKHLEENCIGCKYCTWACPYDAPKYNPSRGIIEKCTFCNHLIKQGKEPACTIQCPTGALQYIRGDIGASAKDPHHIGPQMLTVELSELEGPEIDKSLFPETEENISSNIENSKISAKKEWPLVVFTLIIAALVAFKFSPYLDQFATTGRVSYILLLFFGVMLSFLHLGKKRKAWRAILNIKGSWLSREILFLGLFTGLVIVDWFLLPIPQIFIAIVGLLLLFSIDMLYQLAHYKWPLKIHSAQVCLITITLFFLLQSWPILFSIMALSRVALYLFRRYKMHQSFTLNTFIRLMCIISAGSLLIMNFGFEYALILFMVGEIIDRIEYYDLLKVAVPWI